MIQNTTESKIETTVGDGENETYVQSQSVPPLGRMAEISLYGSLFHSYFR